MYSHQEQGLNGKRGGEDGREGRKGKQLTVSLEARGIVDAESWCECECILVRERLIL